MSKKKKGNGHHHLTLSDRIYIESELNIGSTFKSIAGFLGKDPSTISKEVRLHRIMPDPYKLRHKNCHDCAVYTDCDRLKGLSHKSNFIYYDIAMRFLRS